MTANNIQFTKIEIRIAKYLFKHYKDKHNARQLAKLLNINHAHSNKLCSILENKHLLTKEAIGNTVYFSFNYNNKLAIKFMDYILSLEEQEVPKWLVVVLHSLKKFKPYIELGLVFGSSIRNKEFNDIRKSQLVEQPIRYMDITWKDIISNKDNKIFYSIISDSLIFHNPEKYVEIIKKCRK